VSLKSPLFPLAVILLSFGWLVLAGHNATKTVAENLRNPRASSNLRIVDLVEWSPAMARVHELTFTRPETGPTFIGEGARLKVQLWSKGRTRLLVVRPAGSDSSRWSAFVDVLNGRGRFQVVADRKWADLGPLPAGGGPLAVQVAGLLPGPFGLAESKRPADPVFEDIRIVRESTPATTRAFPRYRISVPSPVDARETLARYFFFISISRVLQIAGLVALVLLFSGWWLLGKERIAPAVCSLISSVVLLHAVCLPPLQGADETSHGATIEALLFRGTPVSEGGAYPRSWSLAAQWMEQDRVQYRPDEPLPIQSPETRARLAASLSTPLSAEAREKGSEAPAATVQGVDTRSPLFFRPFGLLGPVLRPIPLMERLSAYRLLSSLSGLLLFSAGALLLHRAGLGTNALLSYGIVWFVPYMVFTVASTSNYAPAIGLGSLLAACVLVLLDGREGRQRKPVLAILVAGSWIGIPLWPDFVFLAPVATAAVALAGLRSFLRNHPPAVRRAWLPAGAAFLTVGLALVTLVLVGTKVGNLGTRMPRKLPAVLDRNAFWMVVGIVAPLVLAALAALAVRHLGTLPAERVRRLLARTTGVFATLVIVGFLLTPWTSIPYETERYWFSKLVREHVKVLLSNSLAWDQDVLSWKFWVGVGGWHDLFLPDALYAVARWLLVAVIVLFPLFAARAISERPQRVAALLLVSGTAASFCVATLILRYLQPGNPWGRFVLPWLPLLVAPLFSIAFEEHDRPLSNAALRIGALLSLWLTVVPTGARFVLGLS